MNTSLFSNTPRVTVLDNRGLAVRDIVYHRHPDTPELTNERITRHRYNVRGFLTQSADPRLHEAGRSNFTYLTDLTGSVLRSQGADNGTIVALSDAAGRPSVVVSNIGTAGGGTEDRSQSVTRTWQYEGASLPGRLLGITEQTADGVSRITERFVYAGNSDTEKALNLAGACVSHYDTAGLMQTDSVSLTGVPLAVTRRLLKDADNPDTVSDWQGDDASVWNDLLAGEGEGCTTLTTTDATGAALTTTDAKGNRQRVAYDVAGLLSGSWLTLKGGTEQVIVASLMYSAAGQKLREEHGNGAVTTYTYEPETLRLTGIKTARPAGHASGAKVLQDLRYEYDPVGNVLKISNDAEKTRFWRNQKVVPENTYIYDSLYQLVSATGREMANAGQQGSHLPAPAVPLPTDSSAYTNYTRIYTYDDAGNLTRISHSAPATNNSYTTNITISDRSNRGVLSALTGNPADVEGLFTAGGQQRQLLAGQGLVWTSRNELLKVMPVVREGGADDRESYRYDGGSQRVLKVSVQQTVASTQMQRVLYLPGLELHSTQNGNTETESLQVITVGEAGRAQVRVLHWETGRPDGITDDQTRYSYDSLTGSSLLELDGDGNIISMEEYCPYGGTTVWTARSRVEANYKTVRYSGRERDATGLYYYGYRYYQPWAGRWLSADPAGTVDGLNLFRMVQNNPIRFRDIDGRFSVEEMTFAGIGIALIIAAMFISHKLKENKRIEGAVNPMVEELRKYAREKIMNDGLSESLIVPFEAFVISEYESKYKNTGGGFAFNVLQRDGTVYAYSATEDKTDKAKKIINEGVDIGRRLNKINVSYAILERVKQQEVRVSSASASTDTSIFDLENTVVRKNKIIPLRNVRKEKITSSSGFDASPGVRMQFTIENRGRFDDLNLNAIDRKILNKAIDSVSEGRVDYKLEQTNEYVVDLASFKGQKRRGAFRLAFTQDKLKRTLTRIIDPHK